MLLPLATGLPFGLLDLLDDPAHEGGDLGVHPGILLPRAALAEAHDPCQGEPPANMSRWNV